MNETVEKWKDIGIHSLARPTITSLFKQTGTYIKHILFFLPRHVCSLNYQTINLQAQELWEKLSVQQLCFQQEINKAMFLYGIYQKKNKFC